jgi:hypothetical protein
MADRTEDFARHLPHGACIKEKPERGEIQTLLHVNASYRALCAPYFPP